MIITKGYGDDQTIITQGLSWSGVGVGPFHAVAAETFIPGAQAAAVHVPGSTAAETYIPGAQAAVVYP